VIDLHSHLLPGLDDGPATLADAVALARAAVADGITTSVCTPHMAEAWPTAPARMREAVDALRARLVEEEIPLELRTGGEITLGWLAGMSDEDLAAASLGGSGRWLLIELRGGGWPLGLADRLGDLEIRGFNVVFAHPERAEFVQRAPDRLHELVGRGALLQLNAESLLGEHGPRAATTAVTLLRGGLAHLIASDAHSADDRPPRLTAGLAAAERELRVDPGALAWMVEEGPSLVIEGRPVRPPRLAPVRKPAPRAVVRPAARGGRRPTRR
jgi:protein-tyrosine phosphatase